MKGPSTSFRFDISAQLANILDRITLYELLRLFKSTKEALREALTDTEAFIAQIPAGREEEDDRHYLQTFNPFPITLTPDDMQIKGEHDISLYYIGYFGLSEVSCIQVDLGSVLSIMPRRVMQHLVIPIY